MNQYSFNCATRYFIVAALLNLLLAVNAQGINIPKESLYNFWLNSPDGLESYNRRGLETTNYRYVNITVERPSADAIELGLTEQRIRNRVELRFLESNIRADNGQLELGRNRPFFYVSVSALNGAFSILTTYNRPVFFDAKQKAYITVGTTWYDSTLGTYGEEGSATFILESLDGLLESFLNAYLSANIE